MYTHSTKWLVIKCIYTCNWAFIYKVEHRNRNIAALESNEVLFVAYMRLFRGNVEFRDFGAQKSGPEIHAKLQ
jgi:hypothetical protein